MAVQTITLSVDDVNAILSLLHLIARVTGDTGLYSRFVVAIGYGGKL